jgi:Flp pilus assembly pilin Flp
MNKLVKLNKSLGQGMTEYIIIVALIAIASIGVYTAFGNVVKGQTGVIAAELSGQGSATAKSQANTAATNANTRGAENKTLADFNKTNGQ